MAEVELKRVPHVITSGTTKIGVILADEYGGLGTILGIEKTTSSNKPEVSAEVGNLLRYGQALRIRVTYNVGTKVKTSQLLCATDKAKTAVVELVGKTFRTSTIKSAGFKRKVRFR